MTVDEYARLEVRDYAKALKLDLAAAEEDLRQFMTAFLQQLEVGEKTEHPYGSGVFFKKLGATRFALGYRLTKPRSPAHRKKEFASK